MGWRNEEAPQVLKNKDRSPFLSALGSGMGHLQTSGSTTARIRHDLASCTMPSIRLGDSQEREELVEKDLLETDFVQEMARCLALLLPLGEG